MKRDAGLKNFAMILVQIPIINGEGVPGSGIEKKNTGILKTAIQWLSLSELIGNIRQIFLNTNHATLPGQIE